MSNISRRTALIGSAALITTTAAPLVAHAALAPGGPEVGAIRRETRLAGGDVMTAITRRNALVGASRHGGIVP